ncbi:Paf1/RNA polymerase II complex, RTF1 component (involved in regulation of TATA box-binding protein) [Handroanthus impetiginosus]|uniref:Paf1/RNA polymerase II complex, RTF1 component (Involved in regulation of TATA box-binding protein) n=1 Tax=Handroanthus impetiginosus TaxID=429701 RepID=A0A2G9G7A0_9LAMI|nr:Paf1/RNA polymerase II complex, RTF1 component (involved in regulation of TATA box-binding protein) [Handroanthus impetiginosus]
MADLEKLLLEAAGRTTTPGRNRHSSPPSRRKQKGSYSDDGSDSKNDDSDDDRAYSNRKPSGSQVPLKKRLDPTDRDDDRSSQEADEDDDYDRDRDSDNDSVGSDLYKDEDDREKLSKLTELEREMILEARATKRSDRDLTEKLKKRKGQDRKGSPPKTHTRSMRSKAERAGALDELVKRRRDAARGGSGSRYSPVKRRSFSAATLSSPSRSGSESHSDEVSTGDGGMADSDDDKMSESKVTFEDIKDITIRRSKLSKWFMEPFFDELIVGCFVRVGIGKSRSGPVYRLCVVRNVDASDPDRQYKLDNKTTYKYLNCVWGNESSAARWQMAMISDSPPIKDEFDQWVREVERSGGHMPTKQEVLEKREAIQKTNTFVYSAATVKQMLQEKKSATWRPLNIAAEKDRLRRALEIAKENEDDAEMERIKARLQELEAARKAQDKDSKAVKLAEMNRRNRVENFKNASELKRVNTSLKAGEAGYDPFSRRWTRSRNYYVANSNGGEAAAGTNGNAAPLPGSNAGGSISAEAGMAATAAALEAAAGAGKLVDTSAPVDQGTESNLLHNFELPISLAVLQKFGGPQGAQAGFMARKQQIEATIGCKVPENDGRRHALTLTVSDYKRRRGLL